MGYFCPTYPCINSPSISRYFENRDFFDPVPLPSCARYRPFWPLLGPYLGLGGELAPGVSTGFWGSQGVYFCQTSSSFDSPPVSRYFQKVVFLTLFLPPPRGQKQVSFLELASLAASYLRPGREIQKSKTYKSCAGSQGLK